jgi:hypothetical protein
MFHHPAIQATARRRLATAAAITLLAATGMASAHDRHAPVAADNTVTANPTGWLQTSTPSGRIDTDNPFFASLGSNGRSCDSCHRQAEGWTISAAEVRERFRQTNGTDPIFARVDGAVSPLADISSVYARRIAYAMLLKRGVLRVGMPMPAHAEFKLTAVDDPYGYASARELSLFRRPLPATNLIWITGVMWDGRETFAPFKPPMDAGIDIADIYTSLASQARDAVLGHEQAGQVPDASVIDRIVEFESHLFTAQMVDRQAGQLNDDGGMGGASILAQQRFWVGINDTLDNDPTGEPFDPRAMRLFDDWNDPGASRSRDPRDRARAAIARGEQLFNSMPIDIRGVAGLNDVTGVPVIHGSCSSCHNAPNIGNHSVALPVNIGIADASRRTPDLPLYTLTRYSTGEVVRSTDPGLAMLTGKWADIGKFKGPILRGLAARAPYFHNGSAATLMDVVDFYDSRFNIGMSARQKSDLVAFLSAL